ncbi:hypothetical protein [Sphingomonas sp. 1P08PE]|uniref:hypothetical protein n=1 Tax=Sphingomonas sp. 1P08PE TaxID=554122 RepID=UPI0039A21F56
MDEHAMIPNDDPAVRAFRAMNHEADARHAEVMARLAETPDYAPSFALTNRKLDWLVTACTDGRTVDDLLAQVEDVTTRLREPDHEAQREAITALNASRKAFDQAREAQEWSNRVDRSIAEQEKQCQRWGIGGLIAGPLGMTMLAYIVVHIMPASWLLAERFAARTLGLGMADAGIRLLVAGNPAMSDAIGEACTSSATIGRRWTPAELGRQGSEGW